MRDGDIVHEINQLYRRHRSALTMKDVYSRFHTILQGSISGEFRAQLRHIILTDEVLKEARDTLDVHDHKGLHPESSAGVIVQAPQHFFGATPTGQTDQDADDWFQKQGVRPPTPATSQVLPYALKQMTFVRAQELGKIEREGGNVHGLDVVALFLMTVQSKLVESVSTGSRVVPVPTQNVIVMRNTAVVERFIVEHGYQCTVMGTQHDMLIFMIKR